MELKDCLGQDRLVNEPLNPKGLMNGGDNVDDGSTGSLSQYDDLFTQLLRLRNYEADLLKEIGKINETFSKLNISTNTDSDVFGGVPVDVVKASGIVMKSKLSFRGKEKAQEYFQLLDLDQDSLLRYSEVRAVHAFAHPYGLVADPGWQSEGAWRATMLEHGYQLQDSAMTLPGFVAYRMDVESRQSLATELLALRCGLLSKPLQKWGKAKQLIRELMQWRVEKRVLSAEELVRVQDRLTFEELQFFLNNFGLSYTKPERKVNSQLLRVYSRLHLSEEDYTFRLNPEGRLLVNKEEEYAAFHDTETFVAQELEEAPVVDFIGWLFSCPTLINPKTFYRTALQWKYRCLRAIQSLDSYSRMIFSFGAHCNDRLIFRDFPMYQKLLRRLQQVFTYKWICTVNSAESAGASLQGVGASLKLMRVDNLEATVKALNAPAGCGTILYVDLLLRQYNKESSGHNDTNLALVRLLHSFLKHHFETEMKTSNNNLNSLQVYITKNEVDDAERLMLACSAKLTPDHLPSVTKDQQSTTTENANEEEEEDQRYLRWKRFFPFYPNIAAYSEKVFEFFSQLKTGTWKYHFSSLLDLYQQIGFDYFEINKTLPESWLTEAGFIRKRFLSGIADLKKELNEIFNTLKEQLQDKKREDDAHAWHQLMMQTKPKGNQRETLKENMMDEDSDDDDASDPHQLVYNKALKLIRDHYKEQTEYDTLGLRLLERMLHQCVGIHALEVISGRNRLSTLLQGCDLGEVVYIATGGSLLPGSIEAEYEKATSKKRTFAIG
eukprot:scaffold1510_cov176-Ochromonas_danica.AAC.6